MTLSVDTVCSKVPPSRECFPIGSHLLMHKRCGMHGEAQRRQF